MVKGLAEKGYILGCTARLGDVFHHLCAKCRGGASRKADVRGDPCVR